MNEILEHRKRFQENILKSFGVEISSNDIEKSEINDIEKAHNPGDIHPNGKWEWRKTPTGYDWRVIKKDKKHSESQGSDDSEDKNQSSLESYASKTSTENLKKVASGNISKRVSKGMKEAAKKELEKRGIDIEKEIKDKEEKERKEVEERKRKEKERDKIQEKRNLRKEMNRNRQKYSDIIERNKKESEKRGDSKESLNVDKNEKKIFNVRKDGTPINLSNIEDENLISSINLVKNNIKSIQKDIDDLNGKKPKTISNLKEKLEDQKGKLYELEEEKVKRDDKKDIEKLTPSELLKNYSIPDVSTTLVDTKKGRTYGEEKTKLSDQSYFIHMLKKYVKEYGKPFDIKVKEFTNFDNQSFQVAARQENEYSYREGKRVTLYFKGKNGRTEILDNYNDD